MFRCCPINIVSREPFLMRERKRRTPISYKPRYEKIGTMLTNYLLTILLPVHDAHFFSSETRSRDHRHSFEICCNPPLGFLSDTPALSGRKPYFMGPTDGSPLVPRPKRSFFRELSHQEPSLKLQPPTLIIIKTNKLQLPNPFVKD